jgi:hypothetical protein
MLKKNVLRQELVQCVDFNDSSFDANLDGNFFNCSSFDANLDDKFHYGGIYLDILQVFRVTKKNYIVRYSRR